MMMMALKMSHNTLGCYQVVVESLVASHPLKNTSIKAMMMKMIKTYYCHCCYLLSAAAVEERDVVGINDCC